MILRHLQPPVKDKLKAHYFDRYAEAFDGNKILSSIGDQSRAVQPGRCYSSDGTDDHIVTPFTADYLMTNYGIEAINLDSQKVGFMGKIPSTEGDGIIAFFGNVGACLYQGEVRIASNLGTDYVGTVHNSSDLRDDQWHEFMFEFDYITDTHKAYVDGELYFEATYNSYSTSAYRFSFAPTYVFVRNSELAGAIEMEMFDLKILFNNELKAWYKMDEGASAKCYDSSGNGNHGDIINASLDTFHSTQDIYSYQNEFGYSTGKAFSIRPSDIVFEVEDTGRKHYLSQEGNKYYFSTVDTTDPNGNPANVWVDGNFNLYRSVFYAGSSIIFYLGSSLQSNTINIKCEVLQGGLNTFQARDLSYYSSFRDNFYNLYGFYPSFTLSEFYYSLSGTDSLYGETYPADALGIMGATCTQMRELLTDSGIQDPELFTNLIESSGLLTSDGTNPNWWWILVPVLSHNLNIGVGTHNISLSTDDLRSTGQLGSLNTGYFDILQKRLTSYQSVIIRATTPTNWIKIEELSIQENHIVPRDESNPTKDALGDNLEYKGQVAYNGLLKQSNCLNFDGIDDYLETGQRVDFIHQTGKFEIEFYASFENYQDTIQIDTVISTYWSPITDPLDDRGGFRIGYSNSYSGGNNKGRLYVIINDNSYSVTSDVFETDGVQHIKIVGDGSKVKIFRNGEDVTVESENNTSTSIVLKSGISPYTLSFCRAYDNIYHYHKGKLFGIKITDNNGNLIHYYPCSEGAGTKVYDVIGGNHGTLKNISTETVWNKQDLYHYNIKKGFSTGKAFSMRPSDTFIIEESGEKSFTTIEGETYLLRTIDMFDPENNPANVWNENYLNVYKSSFDVGGSNLISNNSTFKSNKFTVKVKVLQGSISYFDFRDNSYSRRFREQFLLEYGEQAHSVINTLERFYYGLSGTHIEHGENYPENILGLLGVTSTMLRTTLFNSGIEDPVLFASLIESSGMLLEYGSNSGIWDYCLIPAHTNALNLQVGEHNLTFNNNTLIATRQYGGVNTGYFLVKQKELTELNAFRLNVGNNTWLHLYNLSIQENHLVPASSTNPNKDVLGDKLEFPAGRHHNGAETQVDFSGGVASPFSTQNNLPTSYNHGDAMDYKDISGNKESNILIYEGEDEGEIIKINNYVKK